MTVPRELKFLLCLQFMSELEAEGWGVGTAIAIVRKADMLLPPFARIMREKNLPRTW